MPRRPSNHVDDPVAVGVRIRAAQEGGGLTQQLSAFDQLHGRLPLARRGRTAHPLVPQILRVLAEQLGTSAEYLATGATVGESVDPLFDAERRGRHGRCRARELYEAARLEGGPLVAARADAALGRLDYESGDHDAAVEALLRATASAGALHPWASPRRGNCLGRSLALLARFDEALAVFERALGDARAADCEAP